MSSNLSKKEEVMSSISIQKLMKCELFGDILRVSNAWWYFDLFVCRYSHYQWRKLEV